MSPQFRCKLEWGHSDADHRQEEPWFLYAHVEGTEPVWRWFAEQEPRDWARSRLTEQFPTAVES